MDLSGVHVPLVTPFDSNGVVDTKSIAHIAEVVIANGSSGIVAIQSDTLLQLWNVHKGASPKFVSNQQSDLLHGLL